jgi:hemerythrin
VPTWTKSLAVGVTDIDRQHQQLFERADALIGAMKQGRPAHEVRTLIHFVGEYCSRHFRSEEDLMLALRYERREEHQRAHAEFARKFREILDLFAAKGPSLTVTVELQDLICTWLVKHIGSEDVLLAKLVARGAERAELPIGPALSPGGEGAGALGASGPAHEAKTGHGASQERRTFFVPTYTFCRGKRILRLDFTGLERTDLFVAFDLAGKTIRAEPPASLRILTILESSIASDTAEAFKSYALKNRPHVFASAIVGTSFWKVIVTDLFGRGREDLVLFENETEALDWLSSR